MACPCHPQRSGCTGRADACHVPIAGVLEIAASARAVKDDGVAIVGDGERLDYLGEPLFFSSFMATFIFCAASTTLPKSVRDPHFATHFEISLRLLNVRS
jgi:hypothetical protein